MTLPWYDNYKLEVWGAQGGDSWGAVTGASGSTYANQHDGGMGGYSYGNYSGTAGATLFVTVGGMGKKRSCRKGGTATTTANGNGYNGGGDLGSWDVSGDWYVGGGGGATHVATVTGLLSSLSNQTNKILIVAGGGGGSAFYLALSYQYSGGGYHYGWGGGGGGATGENATHIYSDNAQWTTGGTGANHPSTPLGGGVSGNTTNFGYGTTSRAGGGGGYYGGTSNNCGGGGGSGYIGGVTDGSMQTGVREGNGYAKITSQ